MGLLLLLLLLPFLLCKLTFSSSMLPSCDSLRSRMRGALPGNTKTGVAALLAVAVVVVAAGEAMVLFVFLKYVYCRCTVPYRNWTERQFTGMMLQCVK